MDINNSRINLVTRFKCSKCGNQLKLCLEKFAENTFTKPNEVVDNITGTDKIENNIYIEPCDICVNKYKKDLETLKKIFKD